MRHTFRTGSLNAFQLCEAVLIQPLNLSKGLKAESEAILWITQLELSIQFFRISLIATALRSLVNRLEYTHFIYFFIIHHS